MSGPRYGYIGLGMMGSAMAEHLLSTGATLTVFDLDQAAVDTAVSQGAVAAGSAADVARESDIISICVPAAHHIEAVLAGPGGIAEGAHEGLTILIHSTVHPDTMIFSRDTAAPWGVQVFDACVAGGGGAAKEGELAIFAGGTDDMSPEVRTLLDIYGTKVINGGEVGAGAAIKIGVNVMTYAQQAAARVSHTLMTQRHADPGALMEAWRHTGQLGKLTEQFSGLLGIPAEHVQGDFRTMLEGTVSIAEKDLELAEQLGEPGAELTAFVESIRAAMPVVMGVQQ